MATFDAYGVPISKIESRARPGAWSVSGFIGKNDTLLDVLQKDWKTVDALGTTHIEFADHLESILDIAFRKEEENKYVTESNDVITYAFHKIYKNTINKNNPVKNFQFESFIGCGMQGDIFYNETEPEPFVGWPGEAWGRHIKLKNPKNGESLLIAEGVIKYIRKYGFYEGGEKNQYRVDPIRLAAVLTGHKYCSIANAIGQACNSRISD